jgi:hypothetical protein
MGKLTNLSFDHLLKQVGATAEKFWKLYEESKQYLPPDLHIREKIGSCSNNYIPIKKRGEYIALYEIPWNRDTVLMLTMQQFLSEHLSILYPSIIYDCTGIYGARYWKELYEFYFLDLDIITVEMPQKLPN